MFGGDGSKTQFEHTPQRVCKFALNKAAIHHKVSEVVCFLKKIIINTGEKNFPIRPGCL